MKKRSIRKIIIISFALGLSVLVGVSDYLTGYSLSFSIFYLIPIALATWKSGKYTGYIISIVCALIWFTADYMGRGESAQVWHLTWNMLTRLGYFFIVVYFLSKRESAFRDEWAYARTDPLTGTRNRRAFNELLEKEIGRAQRYGRQFSFAYIDCDNFKSVNDSLGHEIGDRLLRELVKAVTSTMRSMDVFGRLGGDEFVLLMPEADESAAGEALKRIRDCVQAVMDTNGWPVTLSIGVVTFSTAVSSIDEIYEKADKMMYTAKNAGKNRIEQKTF